MSSGSLDDRSLKQLVGDLKQHAALLARQELALVKGEAKQKAVAFGVAGLLAYAGVLVLLAALVMVAIALGVVAWLAALIVGVIVFAAAFLMAQRARGGPEAQR